MIFGIIQTAGVFLASWFGLVIIGHIALKSGRVNAVTFILWALGMAMAFSGLFFPH